MAAIAGFGSYLPPREVSNAEMAELAGCSAAWIAEATGIEARRFASEEETIPEMAARAARDCMDRCSAKLSEVGLIVMVSGSHCGADPLVRAGPPGPALRSTNGGPIQLRQADGGVGRGPGGPPHN